MILLLIDSDDATITAPSPSPCFYMQFGVSNKKKNESFKSMIETLELKKTPTNSQ